MYKTKTEIHAESGKKLKYNNNLYSYLPIDKINEVQEVYPVLVYTDTYYISGTTYEDIVSELIRQKYSLDAELALIANSRIGKTSKEEEFQSWRKICKEVAKKLTNE